MVNTYPDQDSFKSLPNNTRDILSWNLSGRQLVDLELLMNGAYSPLNGYMNKRKYESVCHSMTLSSGLLWPLPVVLDV